MPVHNVTLEQAIDLSRRLPLSDRLRLISILSEELSREIAGEEEAAEGTTMPDEESQLLAELRAAGLLMEPTPEMQAHADEYDARYSPEEQETILQELRSIRLDPPLSEVIARAREFRPGWRWIVEGDEKG